MPTEEKPTIPLELIEEAAKVLEDMPVICTPLVKLNIPYINKEIYLKLENLQPFSSFKVRGACFAVSKLTKEEVSAGVSGASAGNFAQSLAYMANQYTAPCTMLVPDYVPNTKLTRMLELGVKVKKVPFSEWWHAIQTRRFEGQQGVFIHPCDLNVMAGHGTIGLEIIKALPNVDTIICPYGSGGLITGVASAFKHLSPTVKVIACEPETAAPLQISLQQGKASTFPGHKSSFVDGMGGKEVLPEMWPYVSHLVDKSVTVSLRQIADSIKLLIDRNCVVAEGAGAASIAAALSNQVDNGVIVCVISGGNIDKSKIVQILNGDVPE